MPQCQNPLFEETPYERHWLCSFVQANLAQLGGHPRSWRVASMPRCLWAASPELPCSAFQGSFGHMGPRNDTFRYLERDPEKSLTWRTRRLHLQPCFVGEVQCREPDCTRIGDADGFLIVMLRSVESWSMPPSIMPVYPVTVVHRVCTSCLYSEAPGLGSLSVELRMAVPVR